jgi:hypothetical protein
MNRKNKRLARKDLALNADSYRHSAQIAADFGSAPRASEWSASICAGAAQVSPVASMQMGVIRSLFLICSRIADMFAAGLCVAFYG